MNSSVKTSPSREKGGNSQGIPDQIKPQTITKLNDHQPTYGVRNCPGTDLTAPEIIIKKRNNTQPSQSRRKRIKLKTAPLNTFVPITHDTQTYQDYLYPEKQDIETFTSVEVVYFKDQISQTSETNQHAFNLRKYRSRTKLSVFDGKVDQGVLLSEGELVDQGTWATESESEHIIQDIPYSPKHTLVTVDFKTFERRVTVEPGPSGPRMYPLNPYVLRPCLATNKIQPDTKECHDRNHFFMSHIQGDYRGKICFSNSDPQASSKIRPIGLGDIYLGISSVNSDTTLSKFQETRTSSLPTGIHALLLEKGFNLKCVMTRTENNQWSNVKPIGTPNIILPEYTGLPGSSPILDLTKPSDSEAGIKGRNNNREQRSIEFVKSAEADRERRRSIAIERVRLSQLVEKRKSINDLPKLSCSNNNYIRVPNILKVAKMTPTISCNLGLEFNRPRSSHSRNVRPPCTLSIISEPPKPIEIPIVPSLPTSRKIVASYSTDEKGAKNVAPKKVKLGTDLTKAGK